MKKALVTLTAALLAVPAFAQSGSKLGNADLVRLTQAGITLQLDGANEGYKGEPVLRKNGTGKGRAVTDDGTVIRINGSWEIRGDQFCRRWKDLDSGQEVCETWRATSKRSVDVYKGDKKIGVNSW